MPQTGRSQYAQMRSGALHQMVAVARFHRHEDAQVAVDLLGEKDFPVSGLSIVGTDLRQVEHVLGRVTYGKLAASGALTGIVYGVMMGLLMSAFTQDTVASSLMTSVPLGIAFFIVVNVAGFSRLGRPQRVNTVSQLVAGTYELLCVPQEAERARALLAGETPGQQTLNLRPGPREQGPHPSQDRPQDRAPSSPLAPGGSAPSQPGRAPAAQPEYGQTDPARTGAGTDGSAAEQDGRRSQARDYQDLPDGRPRYGVREQDIQDRPSAAGSSGSTGSTASSRSISSRSDSAPEDEQRPRG